MCTQFTKCPYESIVRISRYGSRVFENLESRASFKLGEESDDNPNVILEEELEDVTEFLRQMLLLGLSTEDLQDLESEENNVKREYVHQFGRQLAEISVTLIEMTRQSQGVSGDVFNNLSSELDNKIRSLIELVNAYSRSCE